jgi:hypothetical protein
MLKVAASAFGASLLLATPASADGWGRPGWGGGWGPPVGWASGVAVAPVVGYQPVVVVGGCGGWGGGCGAGWGPGWGPPRWGGGWRYGAPGWDGGYGWSASHGYSIGYGPAYANWGRGAGVTGRSYGFGPGVRVTRVTRVGVGARPGIVGAGFRR